MIDTRIVCTHDALKMAETLMRLLAAEGRSVRLSFGRQALAALEGARAERDAVVLIWSPNARSQTYMIEWAHKIDPSRLIELACIADPPKLQRKAPAIDFAKWRGERGGRAWDTLNERLRAVTRTLEPPKPQPMRAVAALGVVTTVAMAGAIGARMHAPMQPPAREPAPQQTAELTPTGEIGGPINAFEPASVEDELHFRTPPDVALIDASDSPSFVAIDDLELERLRNETLLERLNALNPLRQRPSSDQAD
jgi:hypothetical protein